MGERAELLGRSTGQRAVRIPPPARAAPGRAGGPACRGLAASGAACRDGDDHDSRPHAASRQSRRHSPGPDRTPVGGCCLITAKVRSGRSGEETLEVGALGKQNRVIYRAVSYTHLTLPTIYSV